MALVLFNKASAKHLRVQRGHCLRTSDLSQAYSLAGESSTAEPEATLAPQLVSNKAFAAWSYDVLRNRRLLQHPTVTPAPLDRVTAAAQSHTPPKARAQQDLQTREEAKLHLLNKQVFWSCHMPGLVERQKLVITRSRTCLGPRLSGCVGDGSWHRSWTSNRNISGLAAAWDD